MQPYQQADLEIKKQGEAPIRGLKTAASLAAGGLALNRVMPLLSQFVPAELAIKGLTKIDPRFGKFINTAMQNGKSFDDVRQFISEKAEGLESTKENRNIIQQYSPELFQEIKDWIQKGALPMQAAAKVYNKHKDIIGKIQKDNKVDWLELVESIFGIGQERQSQQQGQEQPQQGQQQAQGGGSSQDQIKAALQKIMQM